MIFSLLFIFINLANSGIISPAVLVLFVIVDVVLVETAYSLMTD